MSDYIFKIVNSVAEHEEINDESQRLCDVKPTGAVFVVTECRGNSLDNSVNVAIGHLIGKGRIQMLDTKGLKSS